MCVRELDQFVNRESRIVAHYWFHSRLYCARKIQRFLSQPFHVAETFTGTPGTYVKLEDTVEAFKRIVDGEFDDLPEQAFYMVGGIEEVIEKAKKLAD